VNPAGIESCNLIDEDCDGRIDESTESAPAAGTRDFFRDVDGDGFGSGPAVRMCPIEGDNPSPGFAAADGDCVDSDAPLSAQIHPGASARPDPHCSGAAATLERSGVYTCPCGGDCPCGGARICWPTWDWDCDGAERPEPSDCTTEYVDGFPRCNAEERAPTETHAAGCGDSVTYAGCGLPHRAGRVCVPNVAPALEPLRCN
jgi:hypothetical protein